jgi:hypothetical protein
MRYVGQEKLLPNDVFESQVTFVFKTPEQILPRSAIDSWCFLLHITHRGWFIAKYRRKIVKKTILAHFLSSSFKPENSQHTIYGRIASSDPFRGTTVLPLNENGLLCELTSSSHAARLVTFVYRKVLTPLVSKSIKRVEA